jgi:hypothetical protein
MSWQSGELKPLDYDIFQSTYIYDLMREHGIYMFLSLSVLMDSSGIQCRGSLVIQNGRQRTVATWTLLDFLVSMKLCPKQSLEWAICFSSHILRWASTTSLAGPSSDDSRQTMKEGSTLTPCLKEVARKLVCNIAWAV